MGGAATVCIQKGDSSRLSYMAYNKSMQIIPNDFELLTAPVGRRDKIVDKLYERESALSRGEYFEAEPGLAPEWYGLNFIDTSKSRVWVCQAQNNIDIIWPEMIVDEYAEGYAENAYALADVGLLRLCNDLSNLPRTQEEGLALPKVTVEDVREICSKRDLLYSVMFVVVTPHGRGEAFI